MPSFRNLSITNKLRFIIIIISGLSLILACGILGVIEVMNFRHSQINELTILSDIIADRCTASLAFDDSKVSQETLETLRAKPSIMSAYIFTPKGDLFAQYRRPDVTSDIIPDADQTEDYLFTGGSLLVYSPIQLDAKKVGSVYIRSDLSEMYALIGRYLLYVVLVLFGSLLVVFFMMSKLQRFISKPILDLANTAEKIAVNMDFSTKVAKQGDDEIGRLVDAFNTMLDQIKQRDVALIESKDRAETSAKKARDLARETYRVNLTLQKEISERKRAFQSMLESEKKYRGIFENAQEGIFRATQENRFLDVNPSMARILGYDSPEELVESIADIRFAFENQSDQERLYRLLESQDSVSNFECRLKRKNNELIWGSIQAISFKDKNNKLIFVEGLIEDITDRKMAEEALKDAYRQLEKRVEERTAELRHINEELLKAKEAADEASDAKSIFLANMSHEIRTPMNGVISAAEIALSEDMPPKIRHYLRIIHSSGNALLGIINDILDFSKIDAGKLVLENHPFRIDDVLNNVIAIFAHTTAEKNIELLVDIDPGMPFGVIGDPLRLQQILTNLMSNSVKFTPGGGVICISIHSEKKTINSIRLIVTVRDTGVGMTSRQLDDLFQAFTQGDTSTTRKFGGTGLGLCISKQLVELMHGEIHAKSEFGKGSEFTFTAHLDLQPAHLQQDIVVPEELKGLDVLIVDDRKESRSVLSSIIQSFGFRAEIAESGSAAIDLLKTRRQKPFDLALIDFKMPDIHGLEAAVIIRNDLKLNLPIVLMIDFIDKAILPDSAQQAVNRLLTKPVMASSVFNTILELFGKKSISEEKPKGYMAEALDGYRQALGGLNILVVEDNPINQEIAVEIFKTIGVNVKIAEDGVKAIEALSVESFDGVLMDIQMPNMDGYEATRRIRENEKFKTLPIIAMTASALPSDEKKCLDAGMNAYVAKPIQLKKLFQTIFETLHPTDRPEFFTSMPVTTATLIPEHPPAPLINLSADASAGLNIDQAMQNLKLSPDVYQRIVDVFFKKNIHTISRMKDFATQKNWKELQSLAHSITGSSGNIGAFNVQVAARNIEKFCADTTSTPVDEEHFIFLLDELDKELALSLASIKNFVKVTAEENPNKTVSNPDLVPEASDLADLFFALKESNPLKISTSLSNLKKKSDPSLINKIEVKIADYDYDEAMKALTKMALELGLNINRAQ